MLLVLGLLLLVRAWTLFVGASLFALVSFPLCSFDDCLLLYCLLRCVFVCACLCLLVFVVFGWVCCVWLFVLVCAILCVFVRSGVCHVSAFACSGLGVVCLFPACWRFLFFFAFAGCSFVLMCLLFAIASSFCRVCVAVFVCRFFCRVISVFVFACFVCACLVSFVLS